VPDFEPGPQYRQPVANECGGELEVADLKVVNRQQVVKTQMVGRVPVARRVCKQCGRQVVCSEMLSRCWQPSRN
jgi:hypothetical protein